MLEDLGPMLHSAAFEANRKKKRKFLIFDTPSTWLYRFPSLSQPKEKNGYMRKRIPTLEARNKIRKSGIT